MGPDYKALQVYLSGTPADQSEVTLTFSKVASIVGAALPASHLNHRQWWANPVDTSKCPQARAWTDAGFKVDMVEQSSSGGWVCFVRRSHRRIEE